MYKLIKESILIAVVVSTSILSLWSFTPLKFVISDIPLFTQKIIVGTIFFGIIIIIIMHILDLIMFLGKYLRNIKTEVEKQ